MHSEPVAGTYIIHCEPKKTAPFYFCNYFVKSTSMLTILAHRYINKFGIKQYQNQHSLLNSFFIMPCETQHAYTCHD